MWPFPNEEQVKTKVKAAQAAQEDQSVQAWGMQKVKEVAVSVSIEKPVDDSAEEIVLYIHKVFEQEKSSILQVLSNEVRDIKTANETDMLAILEGLKKLQEAAKVATSEVESRFSAEFAKEMIKHMSEGTPKVNEAKDKWVKDQVEESSQRFSKAMDTKLSGLKSKIKNFKDLGNYVGVESKS